MTKISVLTKFFISNPRSPFRPFLDFRDSDREKKIRKHNSTVGRFYKNGHSKVQIIMKFQNYWRQENLFEVIFIVDHEFLLNKIFEDRPSILLVKVNSNVKSSLDSILLCAELIMVQLF